MIFKFMFKNLYQLFICSAKGCGMGKLGLLGQLQQILRRRGEINLVATISLKYYNLLQRFGQDTFLNFKTVKYCIYQIVGGEPVQRLQRGRTWWKHNDLHQP